VRIRRRWRGITPPPPLPAGAPADTPTVETPAHLRVGRISITADHLVDSEHSLARKLPYDENDPFRRGDLLEGRETLREHYVAHGYPAAEVDMIEEEPDPSTPGRVNVRYVIRSGPPYTLEIAGPVRSRPIRKAVKSAWKEPILLEDLLEAARKAALGLLKGKGFFMATVEAGLQIPAEDHRTVRLDLRPGPKVQVRSISISGNTGITEDRIRRQMLTREKGWVDLFGGGLLKEPVLTDDIDAIKGLYLANGYLSARVAQPKISFSEDGRQADVALQIEEGPQSRIEAVSIEGEVPDIPPEELMKATSLSTSQVVSTQVIELATDQLREKLDKDGYSRARVTYRLEGAPERTHVIFSIAPAERARVKSITIDGNTRTHSGIVRREIVVKEGDYLSRAAVLATQRNLYRLGVFRSVQVDSTPIESNPGWVNVRISLQEGSPILTAWGVGYDTEDKARATFEIANNNLFGTRRSAALFLRDSTVDRRVQITLRDPNLFAQDIETLLSVFAERQEMTSFDLLRYGEAAQLSRKFGEHTTVFGRYRLEDIDLFHLKIPESETGQQTVRLGSVAASVAYDTRDDIVSPTHGLLSSADVRLYKRGLGSEESFVRLFGSTALFKDIGHHVIWASSARGGYLTSDAPISERFFAGGDTTLRGFSYNSVSPEDPKRHKPIGGQGLFLFNQELRFPIFKALKGVVFYDGGNVFGEHGAHHFTNWRHVLGLGFRFDTPVGPFRVEYGRKVDRGPGESSGEFFFSIGQAF
jgi:outer membrane protein assembly complex protein YaeT